MSMALSIQQCGGDAPMSNAAVNWAYQQKLPHKHKALLVNYADRADGAGECFGGYRDTASRTGLNPRDIARLNDELEAAGAFKIRRGDARHSNYYMLDLTATVTIAKRTRQPRKPSASGAAPEAGAIDTRRSPRRPYLAVDNGDVNLAMAA